MHLRLGLSSGLINNNWEIWYTFNDEALKMARTGRENYSAYTIIEVMHWNHDLTVTNNKDRFKISNDAIPRLARLFKAVNPAYATFFKTKPSANLS